jgi:hypothetical protein
LVKAGVSTKTHVRFSPKADMASWLGQKRPSRLAQSVARHLHP